MKSATCLSRHFHHEPCLFDPERSLEGLSIDSKVEDLVEEGSSRAERVGNNNWYINKSSVRQCMR